MNKQLKLVWCAAAVMLLVGSLLVFRDIVTQGQYGASIFLVLGSIVSIAFLYAHEWLRTHKQD